MKAIAFSNLIHDMKLHNIEKEHYSVKPLTTQVMSFLSLKQSPRTKPLSPDKTLVDP